MQRFITSTHMRYNSFMHTYSRGYVGLIALLAVTAIIAFLVWKVYIPAAPVGQTTGGHGFETQSEVNAIQKAKDMKSLLEAKNAAVMQ